MSRPRNTRVALACAAVFVAMVGGAFAAVPLYRAFCQATGFNGTVRRGVVRTIAVSDRSVTVRFDTNVRDLAWRFEPAEPSQSARLGENRLAFFRATNIGRTPLTGRALYNILPEAAGPYFSKLECFCFRTQTIAPGQTAEFPVVYRVDPAWAADKDASRTGEITLSYTFFPADGRPSPLGAPQRAGL